MREAISLVLRWHGLRTESFESAEAFLVAADGREIACIILDLRLPGIDGLELQRRLSLAPGSPPVIVVSAHADDRATKRRSIPVRWHSCEGPSLTIGLSRRSIARLVGEPADSHSFHSSVR